MISIRETIFYNNRRCLVILRGNNQLTTVFIYEDKIVFSVCVVEFSMNFLDLFTKKSSFQNMYQ